MHDSSTGSMTGVRVSVESEHRSGPHLTSYTTTTGREGFLLTDKDAEA